MEILTSPNRANEYGDYHARRPADENGGQPLVSYLQIGGGLGTRHRH